MKPARFRLPALSALMAVLVTAAGCSSLFFYPTRELEWTPAQDNVPYRDGRCAAADGTPLHGWLLGPRGGAPRGTILFLHGNAQNIGSPVPAVLWIVEGGYELFAFDYRGYGGSGGKPDIPGVHADARAAAEKLLSLPGVSPGRTVVFGQSLGGSIAVHTVANLPPEARPAALIVDSPFAGYRRIVRDKLAESWLTWPFARPGSAFVSDGYSAERWIDKAGPGPVVVIHGTRDGIVPYEHGKILYGKARDPKGFSTSEGSGHILSLQNPPGRRQFLDFLEAWVPPGDRGACNP